MALWAYRRRAKGLPNRATPRAPKGSEYRMKAPSAFEDKHLQKLLNAIADYAGRLIETHQQTLQGRIETLERENTHLRDEVETLKKELTLQALSFKKQEQEFKRRVLAKAGGVGGD
jgi:predicted RNase H-like nuclease (RuvC/YqgF family)